jgi:hypothetical protein
MTTAQKFVERRYPEADAYPVENQDAHGEEYTFYRVLDDADQNEATILGQGATEEAAWESAAAMLGSKVARRARIN